VTLREAIEQQISIGIKDPREIAQAIGKHFDSQWLASELLTIAEDIVVDLARHQLSSSRRSAMSLTRVAQLPRRDLMLQAAWLPGIGWVEFGRFTAEMFDRLAGQYRKGAAALSRYAEWCESNATLMRDQGVEEFRQVRGALSALPAAEAI
jgi:hypothetical protein